MRSRFSLASSKPTLLNNSLLAYRSTIFWRSNNRYSRVRISPELKRYVVDIVNATREAEGVQLGASPRGSLALMKVAQALALFDGYDFVTPDSYSRNCRARIGASASTGGTGAVFGQHRRKSGGRHYQNTSCACLSYELDDLSTAAAQLCRAAVVKPRTDAYRIGRTELFALCWVSLA